MHLSAELILLWCIIVLVAEEEEAKGRR